jgi:hypothetical protein
VSFDARLGRDIPRISDCRRDKLLHSLRFAHIGLRKNGFAPITFDRLDCFLSRRINITDHNLRAGLCKKQRGRATNASTPARDKRDFV